MAGLAYFAEFLGTTNLFDHFVQTCPLSYQSNNLKDELKVKAAATSDCQSRWFFLERSNFPYAEMASMGGAR